MRSRFAALLVIATAVIGTMSTLPAQAQTAPAPARSPSALAQRECEPGTNAPTLGEQDPTRNLSDRLAQSKGVICPPHDIDPQMDAPPPAEGGGKMPFIAPPGGGNPNAQPR
jgi:hypothetical protein